MGTGAGLYVSETTEFISEGLEDAYDFASDTVKYVSDWAEDIGDEYFSWLKYNPAC